jgi:hypothetical protein
VSRVDTTGTTPELVAIWPVIHRVSREGSPSCREFAPAAGVPQHEVAESAIKSGFAAVLVACVIFIRYPSIIVPLSYPTHSSPQRCTVHQEN